MKRFIPILWAALLSMVCYTGAEAASPPTNQARYIGFSNVTSTSVDITFLRGNGAKRAVVVSTDNTWEAMGANTTDYADNGGNFSGAAQIGASNDFVVDVLTGTDRSTTITNLSPGTTYYVRVYEYNHLPTPVAYNANTGTNNPRSFTTALDAPQALAAVSVGSTTASFAWNNQGSAEGYEVNVHYETGANNNDGTYGNGGGNATYADYNVLDIGTPATGNGRDTMYLQDITNALDHRFEVRAYVGRTETDWSSVDFQTTNDATPPAITSWAVYTDAAMQNEITVFGANKYLTDGTYYLQLQFDEELAANPTLSIDIDGVGAGVATATVNDVSNLGANAYLVSFTVDPNYDGTNFATVAVVAEDLSGNATDGNIVGQPQSIFFDDDAPGLSSFTVSASGNVVGGTEYAKDGESVTLNPVFDESVYAAISITATTAISETTIGTVNNETVDGIDFSNNAGTTDFDFAFDVVAAGNQTTEGAVDMGDVTVYDRAGNSFTFNESAITAGSVDIDYTSPTVGVDDLDISSSNVIDANYASAGQTLTIQVTSNEAIYGQEEDPRDFDATDLTVEGFTGRNSNLGVVGNTTWSFDYTVVGDEGNGTTVDGISFDIYDAAGNSTTVGDANLGDNVTYDFTAPTVTTLTVSSNNGNNPVLAKSGDVATIDFHTSEYVYIGGVAAAQPTSTELTIEGAAATSVVEDNDQDQFTVTRTLVGTEGDGALNFSFTVSDIAGNEVTFTEFDINGSNITLDFTGPVANPVAVVSDNFNTAFANSASTLTFTLTTDENVWGTDANGPFDNTHFSIEGATGNNANAAGAGTQSVTVDYNVQGTETEDAGVDAFSVTLYDEAGNSTVVDQTDITTNITYDFTSPTIAAFDVTSNNPNNNKLAKNGEIITADIHFSEDVFQNDGTALEVTDMTFDAENAGSINIDNASDEFTYTFTLSGDETEAAVALSTTVYDIAGNTVTFDETDVVGGNVVIDMTGPAAPTVNVVSDNFNNGYANSSSVLTFTLNAAENVWGNALNGAFATIDADIEDATQNAASIGGEGTNTVTFTYNVDGNEANGFGVGNLDIHIYDEAGNETLVTEADINTDIEYDFTAPAVFVTGTVEGYNGTNQVANYFNGGNDGIEVTVPVANEATLEDGTIQISISGGDVDNGDVGAAHSILFANLGNDVVMQVTRAQLEAAGLADGETATVTATITDRAGNTTSDDSDVVLTSDQTVPNAVTLSTFTDAIDGIDLPVNSAGNAYYQTTGNLYLKFVANEALSGGNVTINAFGNDFDETAQAFTGGTGDTWNYTWDLTGGTDVPDGSAITDIDVTVTDVAGNVATITALTDESTDAPWLDDVEAVADQVEGILTLGAPVVAGYLNAGNTNVTINIPLPNDPSLIGGNIQAVVEVAAEGAADFGGAYTPITSDDLTTGFKVMTFSKASLEALSGGLQDQEVLTFSADVTDFAGNERSYTASATTLTYDILAPAAPVVTAITDDNGVNNDGKTFDQTLVFDGTSGADASVEVFIDAASIGTTTADGLGAWMYDHTGTTLAYNTYQITAVATDAAGNVSPTSAQFEVVIENTVPTVVTTVDNALINLADNGGTLAVTATFSEEMNPAVVPTIAFEGGLNATLTAAGGNAWTVDNTVYTFNYNISNTGGEVADIDITIDNAEDAAGNDLVSTTTQDLIDIDQTAPTITSIKNAADQATQLVNGDMTYYVTFSEAIDLGTLAAGDFTIDNGGTVNSINTATNPIVTVSVSPAAGQDNVAHSLTFTGEANDLAGNAITNKVATTNQTYTVDNVLPELTSIVRHNPVAELTNASFLTYRVNFTEEVDGVTLTTSAGIISNAYPVVDNGGFDDVWEVVVESGADGVHGLTITAYSDLANNAGTDFVAGTNETYTVDRTAPVVNLLYEKTNNDLYINEAEQLSGNDITARVNLTAEANADQGVSFYLTEDGAANAGNVGDNDINTAVSVTATGLSDVVIPSGNKGALATGDNVYLYAVDAAGNIGIAANSLAVDITPPTVATSFTRIEAYTGATLSLIGNPRNYRYANLNDKVVLFFNQTENLYNNYSGYVEDASPATPILDNTASGAVTASNTTLIPYNPFLTNSPFQLNWEGSVTGSSDEGPLTFSFDLWDAAGNIVTIDQNDINGVGDGNDGQNVIIDLTKPTVTDVVPSVATITDAQTGDNGFSIDITVNETYLNTAVQPTITFSPDISGTLSFDGASSSWAGNVFTAVYDVTDSGVEIADIDVIINGIADLAGNVMNEDASNTDEFSIDNLNPSATITTSDALITDADNGGTYTITATFDEAMNTGVTPTLNFAARPATLTNYSALGWTGNTVYRYSYSIGDENEETADIDFNVTGGQDVAGNTMVQSDATDILDVDQRQPLLTAVTPNLTTIADANAGDATFTLTLDFDEAMNTGVAPTVDFNTDISSTLTLDGTSGWSDADTYVARYDVADAGVSVADIDVTVTLAQDAVGNVMASDASNIDEFSIDTENPTVTSVTADQANGTYGIGSSITTQIIFSEAVTSNFGGGTPTMTFETGTTDRTVNMSDGTNNDVFLQAVYTVQEDDVTSDLDYVAANTITLNGGTITDAAGNAAVTTLPTPGAANSLGANKDIVIDGIRPTLVSISRQSPAQEITNSNAVDFRVVFSEGLSGLLSSDFQLSGAGSANGVIFNLNVVNSTTIDVQVSGLNTSGNLTLGLKPTANLSDVNGNTMTNLSATGTVQTYTMDFTNPVISISAPSANAYVNGTSTNLTFTVTETNTGTSSADASNGGNLAAFTSGSAVNTLNGWAGADGARTILVSHTDQAGNTGTATVTVTKDETNPVITWTSPAASTRVNSAYAIDFALTEANTGTSEIQVAGGSWATVTDGTTFGNIAAFSSATDGNVNIALRHTDLAGNVTTEATRTVVKDFTAPTASILAVTNTPTNANAVSWTVTFSEDVQNFDANDLTVTATNELAPNDFTVGVATVSASEYTVTVTPNNTQDNGSVYFELNTGGGTNVTDLANNAFATAVTSSTIVIDNSAPKITATSIASNNSYVDVTFDQGVYTTSGFGAVVPSDWSTTVTQNGGLTSAVTISSITKTNGNAATGGETQLRFNLSLTGLPTGQESFTIAPATNTSVYNLIGNAMETTDVSSSINLNDQTAPVVNITAPVTNAYVNGNATLTFTATDAIGVTGTTARAGAATDVAVITGATLTSISGFTAASDGVVTLTVSATDAAGNTGTATVNVNKDATNPTLTVAQLAQTETNGTHTVTITASSDANPATPFIQASVNNSDWATVANGFAINTAGGWAGLAEGNATLYVRASDLAGNTTVVSQSIVKDVTAPVLTLTPASGAINVALNSNVEIASLSEDLYVIADGNIIESSDVAGLVELKQTNDAGASIAYTGTVTDNGNGHTITLDPTNNFESNDVVYVELNAGLRDKAGNALASTNYTFTTVDNSTTRMAFETVEVALPALSDTQGERVKIATLTVTDDQGGDNDTKPTKITGITFDQGGDNQIGTWTQVFDGVEIERQGVAGKVVGTVNGTNFAFTGIAAANAGDMGYINDGSAGSFDVYAWVKADIDDAIDNTIDNAYFQIAADYNDVTTAAGGSNMDYTLRPVPTVVTDTKDSITVVGTKLVLVSNLTDVPSVSSTQNAQFEITDDNGNRDEITKSVSLTTNSGTSGVTISSPTGGSNTINGLVSFTITYSNFGALVQTTAQSSGLASATSNAFNVRANEPTNAPSSITTTPFNGQWNIEVNFTTNPTGGKAIIVAYQGANNAVVNDADFGDGLALSANVSYGSGTGLDMDNGAGTGYVVYQGTKPTSNVKIWMTPNTYDFIAYSYDGDKNKAGTVNIKTDAVARSSDVVLTKVGDFEAASADNFDGDLYVSQVYPNPVTRGEFKFDIVSLQDSYYTITLNDLSGKTVYTHANNEYMSAGEHTMEVNFDSSKIASGMYMMYVESELGVFVVPVNIQN